MNTTVDRPASVAAPEAAGATVTALDTAVTVVIPAYRAADTIVRAVESVRAQQGVRVHCIVVLDGDDAATVRELRAFPDVEVVVHHERAGAPVARNAGLARADGEFVMFLDADDAIEGPLLREAVAALADAEADLCLADCRIIGWKAGWWWVHRNPEPRTVLREWLWTAGMPPCTTVWRTAFVRAIGGWDPGLLQNQDGELIYRACLHDARVVFAEEGNGVYFREPRPQRITQQMSPAIMSQHRDVFRNLVAATTEWQAADANFRIALGYRAFYLAFLASGAGCRAIYEELRRLQAAFGFEDRYGELTYPRLRDLLGLYYSERLLFFMRRTKARWYRLRTGGA